MFNDLAKQKKFSLGEIGYHIYYCHKKVNNVPPGM